jgi:SAM-dependent methyltransferase
MGTLNGQSHASAAPVRAARWRAPATREVVASAYPGYEGPVAVYGLQLHIANRVLEPILDRHLQPGGTVADLGCGSGTMLNQLRDRAGALVGVDLDPGAFHKYPDLDLRQGSIYDLPIESGTIDVATSKWVFEHLAEPERGIAEIRRILKPGGVAVIAAPNVLHPTMALSWALPTWVKQRALAFVDSIEEELVLPTYYRANTEPALDGGFERAGFAKLEFAYWGDPSYWLFSSQLFRLAERARAIGERVGPLRRLAMNLVGTYRAPG